MTGRQLALLMLDVVSGDTASLSKESDDVTMARMSTWARNRAAFVRLAIKIPEALPSVFASRLQPGER
jgi:hypothetical protein